ncbi:Gfo/Idh/MocA family protein [Dyella lipolytica]|uniref:Gfo/Idh/MocA family oxidoreductase n=1 Tax=Dyella lipolytica TaxID=1867835 RepID=A0ABW8ISU7_9GAMM|nr:Gfo/Idh/MocA family oxidoreductase [Dyella lipolytica]
MQQVIRWGILGTGVIAHKFAAALRNVPGATLAAVASRTSGNAKAFGRDVDVSRCHGSYQELADDAEVDVIYVATPHPQHAENTLMCLQGGKAVLCEKPFTMNLREARAAIELARQKNLFLMEAMWTRFLPVVAEAKRVIASGEIGRVQQCHGDFGFAANDASAHRLYDRDLGGGALLDVGIYPLSLAAYFLGAIDSVTAVAQLGDTGVDMQTAFTLQHRGGAVSSCACAINAQTPTELTIAGDLGYLRLESPFYVSNALTVVLANGERRTIPCPYIGNGYCLEAMEVTRCLREGLIESPVMSHDESLALMTCLDLIREQIGLTYPADLNV